jgi:hypothetical protein
MLPSLARLAPTGAALPSSKFTATARFIHGNPDRLSLDLEADFPLITEEYIDDDVEILTRWVLEGFGIRERLIDYDTTKANQWIQMSETEFKAGIKKLTCDEEHAATTFGYNGRYHIERQELVLTDTNGAMTWTFVVAVNPRGL